MANIIVAFSKIEDAKSIKNVLVRNGFSVAAVCSTGAQTINYAESLDHGIVVCGYRFPDMMAPQLMEELPQSFDMLMVASPAYWDDRNSNIVFVGMPLKINDLINSLNMVCQAQERRRKKMREIAKVRSEREKNLITNAKRILMERNGMTESEAHHYIQKCSMDSGTNMVETAQMIISIMF
jgi:response regulator NasT